MRYAIVSDIHGRREKLAAVLDDAQQRGAEQVISLGDVGGDDCLNLLRQSGARWGTGSHASTRVLDGATPGTTATGYWI